MSYVYENLALTVLHVPKSGLDCLLYAPTADLAEAPEGAGGPSISPGSRVSRQLRLHCPPRAYFPCVRIWFLVAGSLESQGLESQEVGNVLESDVYPGWAVYSQLHLHCPPRAYFSCFEGSGLRVEGRWLRAEG